MKKQAFRTHAFMKTARAGASDAPVFLFWSAARGADGTFTVHEILVHESFSLSSPAASAGNIEDAFAILKEIEDTAATAPTLVRIDHPALQDVAERLYDMGDYRDLPHYKSHCLYVLDRFHAAARQEKKSSALRPPRPKGRQL